MNNRKAFTGHKVLLVDLRGNVYFAHSYHSWKRGLNEKTNGLIRQYLPKGPSFEGLIQRQLDMIVKKSLIVPAER